MATSPDAPASAPPFPEAPAPADPLAAIPPPAAAADRKPSRSGTSGAERRRRAKAEAEAAGTKPPAVGAAARDRAPKGKPAKASVTAAEKAQLVAALDKLLPYVALRDPYTAAVINRRKVELADAVYQVPVLSDLVRWAARLQGGSSNPYVVIVSVVLPVLAHHGKLPAKAGATVGIAATFLKLEPSAEEVAVMSAAGAEALATLVQVSDVMQSVADEAAAIAALAEAQGVPAA